jgi:hypothetical protein
MAKRPETAAETEARTLARAALEHMGPAIDEGRVIFCEASAASPGADCWDWLQGFINLVYKLIKANRLTNLRIIFTYDERERR